MIKLKTKIRTRLCFQPEKSLLSRSQTLEPKNAKMRQTRRTWPKYERILAWKLHLIWNDIDLIILLKLLSFPTQLAVEGLELLLRMHECCIGFEVVGAW